MTISLSMLVDLEILKNFLFSCPGKLLQFLMQWRSVFAFLSSLLIALPQDDSPPHRNFSAALSGDTRMILSWLVSSGPSAMMDHSDVFGSLGDAIPQDRFYYQSTSTPMSMFRGRIHLNGRS